MNLIRRIFWWLFPKTVSEKIVEAVVNDTKTEQVEVFSDNLKVKFSGNEMKEKLTQLVNAFAEKNGLTVKKVEDVDGLWDTDTSVVRELYALGRTYGEDNIDREAGLWLVRGKYRDCIRFDCYRGKLLGAINSELIDPIKEQFPEVDVWFINRENYVTVYDTRQKV